MKRITFTADKFTVTLIEELAKLNPSLYKNRSQCLRLAVQALVMTARQGKSWQKAKSISANPRTLRADSISIVVH